MGEQGAEAPGNWVWQEVPQSWELAGHRVTSEGGGLGDSDPRGGVRQWCPKGENFLGGALPQPVPRRPGLWVKTHCPPHTHSPEPARRRWGVASLCWHQETGTRKQGWTWVRGEEGGLHLPDRDLSWCPRRGFPRPGAFPLRP